MKKTLSSGKKFGSRGSDRGGDQRSRDDQDGGRSKVGNVEVEVVKGDITRERSDVIVNSVRESLDLSTGTIDRLT